MCHSVSARREERDFLSLCRAIFHDQAVNGTSVSFFNNFIMKTE